MIRSSAFKSMLFVQWKLQRAELVGLALLGAAIAPLVLWSRVSSMEGVAGNQVQWLMSMTRSADLIKPASILLALGAGLLLALRPFAIDARAKHTYALALPVPRAEYALMRALSGLVLIAVPAAGFLIGALVATQIIPDTWLVRRFPIALTVRFVLAVATAFAVAFGIQYGLGSRARRWLLIVAITIAGFELFGQMALRASLVAPAIEVLNGRYSPVRLYVDRWALFDV